MSSVALAACSVDESDESPSRSPEPGSLLREAAGLPSSINDELMISSNYAGQMEDAISSCMRSNGFEYFSEHGGDMERILSFGFELPSDEYAQRYGFGIVAGAIQGFRVQADEHAEYLANLTPEEFTAYRVALEGEDVLKDIGAKALEIGGCRRVALDSVDEPAWYAHTEWLDAVSTELSQRLAVDSRIIEIEAQWIECMAASGYSSMSSEEQLSNSLNDEFTQLFRTLVPKRPFRDGEEFLEALDDESRAALEKFRAREIKLAVASHDCSSEHDGTVLSISREIERSILASHPMS